MINAPTCTPGGPASRTHNVVSPKWVLARVTRLGDGWMMRSFRRAVLASLVISMLTAGVAAADPKADFDSRGSARIPAFSAGEKDAQANLRDDLGGKALTGRVRASPSAVSITGLKDQLTDPAPGGAE